MPNDRKTVRFNGRTYTRSPGRRYYIGAGFRALHRDVYEHHHGPIPKGWHVHHVDHDLDNNNPSNLEALSPSGHADRHATQDRPVERPCDFCGERYWTIRRTGPRAPKWCSTSCRDRDRRRRGVYAEDRTCVICSEPFTVAVRSDRTQTCGRECAERLKYHDAECEQCGIEFVAKRPWARFCSSRCKQRARAARARAGVQSESGG